MQSKPRAHMIQVLCNESHARRSTVAVGQQQHVCEVLYPCIRPMCAQSVCGGMPGWRKQGAANVRVHSPAHDAHTPLTHTGSAQS